VGAHLRLREFAHGLAQEALLVGRAEIHWLDYNEWVSRMSGGPMPDALR